MNHVHETSPQIASAGDEEEMELFPCISSPREQVIFVMY